MTLKIFTPRPCDVKQLADLGDPNAPEESDSEESDSEESDSRGVDSKGVDSKETESEEAKSGETESEKAEESDSEESDSEESDSEESDSEESDSEESDSEEKSPKKDAVPEGYVPLEALHQARENVKRLKQEISAIKAQKTEAAPDRLFTKAEAEKFEDFTVLSKAKLAEKFEDDPVGAAEYTEKLSEYYDFKNREAQQKVLDDKKAQDQEAYEVALKEEYSAAEKAMEEALPGIFSDEGVQKGIAEFAESIGFNENLFFLTSPVTQVIPPGGDTPVPLGTLAADVLKSLVSARSKAEESKPVDTKALEKEIRVKVEKEIRAELEKEVLSKVKKRSKKGYTSLDDIPTSGADKTHSGKVLTEGEFDRLSPAAQEEYLKGN
ncbi:MAG: hypothetical protein P8X63_07815 [Desulfuromonadaceae bacterium]